MEWRKRGCKRRGGRGESSGVDFKAGEAVREKGRGVRKEHAGEEDIKNIRKLFKT